MERARELVAKAPELREMVRQLGRWRTANDAPPLTETVFVAIRRVSEEVREIRTPLAPTETRGVERSGAISRMLPSEAAMLSHPVLRTLWHARRAEQALLTYRVEGVLTEKVLTETEEQVEERRVVPRPERGPIMVCLDTSGSMHGAPETIAKAVTLEALRVACEERRACYLYAFSGPRDVVEHELDLSPAGLQALLRFLSSSFHGGTDVAEPMRRAVARLGREAWRRADVLLVSDGEFPVDDTTVRAVATAKRDADARFHGLLVGNHSTAMQQLCDPVHRFREWSALGGA